MSAVLSDFDRIPRILRLNIAGQPVEWVSWKDAVCLYARELVSWTVGEPLLSIRGGHSRINGDVSTLQIHSIIACDGQVVSRDGLVVPLTNQALFRRDGNLCLYCGKTFADFELTRDHVVPVSKGGGDAWDNVVASCRRCNHHKGSRLLEDCVLQLLALPYVPNLSEYLALINSGRILGDQMQFLSKTFGVQSRLLKMLA
jgi:5-methylcytosine-specific restriction endonuclease McrA